MYHYPFAGGFPYPSVPNAELLTYLQQGNRLDKPKNASSEVYISYNNINYNYT